MNFKGVDIKINDRKVIISGGILLTVLYYLIFTPVYNYGDAPVYIDYARAIAEKADTSFYIHRSPLYPWVLSFFVTHFEVKKLASFVVFIQYMMIFFSGYLFFLILKNHFEKSLIPLVSTLFYYLNFSVIFYGYMVLTEILTLFLFILTLYHFDRALIRDSDRLLILSGITASFLCLCRFNILPVVFLFALYIILYGLLWWKDRLLRLTGKVFIFSLPVIFILNGYALRNYLRNDFYGVFPSGGSLLISRNALVSTIKGNEEVSDSNRAVLQIFTKYSEEYRKNSIPVNKGSFLFKGREKILRKIYGGYLIYMHSVPELCKHYGIDSGKPEPALSRKLVSFYSEIKRINRKEINELRFLSLFNSLRSSTGLVLNNGEERNLDKLPVFLIKFYKILVFIFSSFVFIISLIYLGLIVFKVITPVHPVILFILLFIGFIGENFLLAVVSDASRYKFPSEPIMIFLGIYFINKIVLNMKVKVKSVLPLRTELS